MKLPEFIIVSLEDTHMILVFLNILLFHAQEGCIFIYLSYSYNEHYDNLLAKMHSFGLASMQGGMFWKKVKSTFSYLMVLSLSPRESCPSPRDLSLVKPFVILSIGVAIAN
jgi:hypothetical protein